MENIDSNTQGSPLRVVQVGVANFGRHRRETLRQSGKFEMLAVHDWNAEAAEAAAVEENCRAVDSYEALLETPGAEAVIISTGATFHAAQVEQAARKGLHVFVEKPVCSAPEEVQHLLDVEQATGVVIAVGHAAHNQMAGSLRVREMIDAGELGTIASFHKVTAHSGGFHIKPGDWRGDPAKNPGGMLFQCGVHGLHELMFLFGPIVEVYATMRHDVHSTKTADVAVCTLRFASGLVGMLSAYHVTPYKHSLDIYGTKANLYRNERFFDEGSSMLLQRMRLDGQKEELEPVEVLSDEVGEMYGNLDNFYYSIREGRPVYPSLRDGLLAVQVVFAAEESFRRNRPVQLPTSLSEMSFCETETEVQAIEG